MNRRHYKLETGCNSNARTAKSAKTPKTAKTANQVEIGEIGEIGENGEIMSSQKPHGVRILNQVETAYNCKSRYGKIRTACGFSIGLKLRKQVDSVRYPRARARVPARDSFCKFPRAEGAGSILSQDRFDLALQLC